MLLLPCYLAAKRSLLAAKYGIAYHFNRSDQASPGVFKFLNDASLEERKHAEMFMEYMNKRGGTIQIEGIKSPNPNIRTIKDAFTEALNIEKDINKRAYFQALLEAHAIASECNDPNMCDFIESSFLEEQVNGIKKLTDFLTQIERSKTDLGSLLFDKYLALNVGSMHKKR